MVPKYMQIVNYVEDLILTKKIGPGEKLPSENELAGMFHTTRMTVRRALLELENKGLIARIPGVGTFVADVNVISHKRIGIMVHNEPIVYGIIRFCTSIGSRCLAMDYGYSLEEEKKALSELLKMGIDGLIIEPHTFSAANDLLSDLTSEGFPIVFVDRSRPGDEKTPVVVSDNRSGGRMLGEHMRKVHSTEKALFVTQESFSIMSVKDRYEGIKEGLGFEPDVIKFATLDDDFTPLVEAVKEKGYDTIFFCNDALAFRGMGFLLRAGLKIPEDVRVVGFDDELMSSFFHPKLTTVRQNLKKMGEMAAALVVNMIRGEKVERINTVGVELVVRQSCGCHL